MNTKNVYKFKKIKYDDSEKLNLAYTAGISSIGMAYKMSIARIDIADALIVEHEAIKLKKDYGIYFNKFTPKMLIRPFTSSPFLTCFGRVTINFSSNNCSFTFPPVTAAAGVIVIFLVKSIKLSNAIYITSTLMILYHINYKK